MSTMYSVGQMNQLGDALEAAGFEPDDVTKLRSFPRLRDFKDVLAGRAEIVVVKHVIDCDADPFVPEGWSVEEHRKTGQIEWDPAKVAFYLSEGQRHGRDIEGNKLRKELKTKSVLNANVLDYLLAHPELIPEEWKDGPKYFWGTVYRFSDGDLFVRYLYWNDGQWLWLYNWLGLDWLVRNPAVLLASSL